MPRATRRRFGLTRGSWFLIAVAVTAVGVGAALAQVTPSTGGTDISTLLQQFGSLFGNGTGTTGTGTTGNTPTTTTQPGGGTEGRAPNVVTDQFDTTSSGALQERRPGAWVRNAMAVQNGEGDLISGNGSGDEPNFYKATFDQIALGLINGLTNLLSGFNFLAGVAPTSDGTTGTTTDGISMIPNSTTTGAGTSTPIQ